MSITNKIIACLLLLASLSSCKEYTILQKKEKIVYYFFDSLECYLANDIKEHIKQKDPPIGIYFDVFCHRCRNLFPDSEYIFQIAMVYRSDKEKNGFMHLSNRYLSIGGKLYGIYFCNLDENLYRNRSSLRDDYPPRQAYHNKLDWLIVDENALEFYTKYYFNESVRGRVKK